MTVIGHPLTTPVEISPTDELLRQLTPEQAEALLKRAGISNREWTEKNVANSAGHPDIPQNAQGLSGQ